MARRTVDVQDGDGEWVAEFERQIGSLAGMVEEMFVTSPSLVLSQIFRELVRDKGRQVAAMLAKVKGRIAVDNLGSPLGKGG